jgi:methionyl-tRNA formyltransferase
MALKIVFLGTPTFAVPTLEALLEAGHHVLEVITQPDRPKGRHHVLEPSPVKACALARNLTVYQPERIRRPESVDHLRALAPDVMVVVGYGQIIPQSIIDIPPRGIVNVHASLLPKLRGAAPIQWSIANGDQITGVTTMQIDAGLDTGAMLLRASTPIHPDETAPELSQRLSIMGAQLLIDTLAHNPIPIPQDNYQATLAPILKKEDGLIDFARPAQSVHNRVRGLQPWPGAYTTFRGHRLHIWKSAPAMSTPSLNPGQLLPNGTVTCGSQTALQLLEVQLEGRKRIDAKSFLNGLHLTDNEILGALSL